MVTLPLEFEGYDLTCKKVYDALMDILEYVNEHEGHTHGSGQEPTRVRFHYMRVRFQQSSICDGTLRLVDL